MNTNTNTNPQTPTLLNMVPKPYVLKGHRITVTLPKNILRDISSDRHNLLYSELNTAIKQVMVEYSLGDDLSLVFDHITDIKFEIIAIGDGLTEPYKTSEALVTNDRKYLQFKFTVIDVKDSIIHRFGGISQIPDPSEDNYFNQEVEEYA